MAIKDSNVTIMVKDMDASISFYESIGLVIKQRWANHYAQLTAPGITIGLHPLADSVEQLVRAVFQSVLLQTILKKPPATCKN